MTPYQPAVWRCPKCGSTIAEGDVPYTAAECRATLRCKGTSMTKDNPT